MNHPDINIKRSDMAPRLPPSATNEHGNSNRRNYFLYLRSFIDGCDGCIPLTKALSDRGNEEKIDFYFSVSMSLTSFIDLGVKFLKKNSPLRERIVETNKRVLEWLDGWVDPNQRIPNLDPNKPIYTQIFEKRFGSENPYDSIVSDFWESLRFVRFLMAKGSVGSIMLNRVRGVDTSGLTSDIIRELLSKNGQSISEKNLDLLMRLYGGFDLDFHIFPAEVYSEVFEEFLEKDILRKNLISKEEQPVEEVDLNNVENKREDELKRYRIGQVSENDIDLPPGFRLKDNFLYCSFFSGQIKQVEIPYRSIEYFVEIVDQKGKSYFFQICSLEFMPSMITEEIIDKDYRTGWKAGLLSEFRAAGVFFLTREKRNPVLIGPKNEERKNTDGSIVFVDNHFVKGLCLPDRPVGPYLQLMIEGSKPFDHSQVATLFGRALRNNLYNSLNMKKPSEEDDTDIYTEEFKRIFQDLSERFNPAEVKRVNYEEMLLGLIQGWLLDFPKFVQYLEDTGFYKHFVLGNENIFQALKDIAQEIKRDPHYSSFLKRLIRAQKGGKEEEPGRIEGKNLTNMIDQNFYRVIRALKKDPRIPSHLKNMSDIDLMFELLRMPLFREFSRENFWGANLRLNIFDIVNLKTILYEISKKLQKPIFGYFIYDEKGYPEITFHISRYPRTLKYNIGSAEEYYQAAKSVVEKMNLTHLEIEKQTTTPKFRVVLGLNKGYSKEQYSFEEVARFLGEGFTLRKGKILSVNPFNDKNSAFYEESAIIIETENPNLLYRIYQAADIFQQHRFAVEDLQKGEAYMIETGHCPLQQSDSIFINQE